MCICHSSMCATSSTHINLLYYKVLKYWMKIINSEATLYSFHVSVPLFWVPIFPFIYIYIYIYSVFLDDGPSFTPTHNSPTFFYLFRNHPTVADRASLMLCDFIPSSGPVNKRSNNTRAGYVLAVPDFHTRFVPENVYGSRA